MEITEKENQLIGKVYEGGDHPYYAMALEPENIEDLNEWIQGDTPLEGLVSEEGIIGYIHQAHIDKVTTALNLRVIHRTKSYIEDQQVAMYCEIASILSHYDVPALNMYDLFENYVKPIFEEWYVLKDDEDADLDEVAYISEYVNRIASERYNKI